ncbi:Sodium/potassium/calcium exchanger 4 [Hypsibius exemplaris]|uniref:Sodium/potassium/calcium exchanger 4 n=1 Tax=Hypsibius exemplaris TaxID=2072580 RepID=A0A1W0W9L4_HYPEX|nr:Sodium/potassium/calcium exchanger 4 [Hypsibius exemplaris]
MPPSATVTPSSHLRKICRCTVFVSIFLLVSDSRLRPTFLSGLQPAPSTKSQSAQLADAHSALKVQGPSESLLAAGASSASRQNNGSPMLRRLKRQAEGEEEETTEEPGAGEEEEEKDAEGAVTEDGEDAEKGGDDAEAVEEEVEEEEEATTLRPRRPTTRKTTTKATTAKTSPPPLTTVGTVSTTDDDDDDTTVVVIATTEAEEKEPACTVPAIRQFPPDLFDQQERRYGAIIIHLFVVVYMFLCLAIVCDDYFCGSLELLCKRMNLSEDVAGATLMAAGSSAPELFTSMIGVFVAKGDVGTGTIVGSAVFNILFVVGTCAFCGNVDGTQLSWWPVCRDAMFYAISIVVLIASIGDGEVTWYESIVMLAFYGLYVATMKYNSRVYEWVIMKTGWTGPVQGVDETVRLSGGGRFDKPAYSGYEQFSDEQEEMALQTNQHSGAMTLPADERLRRNPRKLTFANAALRIMMSRYFYPRARFVAACRYVISENQVWAHEKRRGRLGASFGKNNKDSPDSEFGGGHIDSTKRKMWASFDVVHDEMEKWRARPAPTAGWPPFIRWIIMYPAYFVLYYTIPDAKKERFAKWYVATFFLSITWIAIFTYIMVWMVTVMGHTMSIPDSIMGITFLAVGTSVPDAMTSLFVARRGMVDMAVSNSIGSNVFDILIGLALPWFIATTIVRPGLGVRINSNGLVYNSVLLFVSVGVAVGGLRSTGWKLTRRVGYMFYITYGIYLILATMIEYNVFGHVNPPMCDDADADLKESIMAKNGQ